MSQKCLDDCANCTKDNGDDICKIAADDGKTKKIESDDEVPDICYKKVTSKRKSTKHLVLIYFKVKYNGKDIRPKLYKHSIKTFCTKALIRTNYIRITNTY